MITRKFTVDELEEEYGLPWEDNLSFERIDKHRWYTVCEVVFRADDGFYYSVDYLEPNTEMQEGQDRWNAEYSTNLVTATKVVKKSIVVDSWVTADA